MSYMRGIIDLESDFLVETSIQEEKAELKTKTRKHENSRSAYFESTIFQTVQLH